MRVSIDDGFGPVTVFNGGPAAMGPLGTSGLFGGAVFAGEGDESGAGILSAPIAAIQSTGFLANADPFHTLTIETYAEVFTVAGGPTLEAETTLFLTGLPSDPFPAFSYSIQSYWGTPGTPFNTDNPLADITVTSNTQSSATILFTPDPTGFSLTNVLTINGPDFGAAAAAAGNTKVTAVPEPSPIMCLGLIATFIGVPSWYRRGKKSTCRPEQSAR